MSFGSLFMGGQDTGGGAAVEAPKIATFQPSGPDVDPNANVFGTFADVQQWINDTPGWKILVVDDRVAAATTENTGVTDFNNSVQLRGITDEAASLNPVLDILDGDQIRNCTEFVNIRIEGNAVAGGAGVDPLAYDFTPTIKRVNFADRAGWFNRGSARMVEISGWTQLNLRSGCSINGLGNFEVIEMTSAPDNLLLFLYEESTIGADSVRGDATEDITLTFDETSKWNVTQTNFLGDIDGRPLLPSMPTATVAAGTAIVPENVANLSVLAIDTAVAGVPETLSDLDFAFSGSASVGMVLMVTKTSAGGTITVDSLGNINLCGDDFVIDDINKTIVLRNRGSEWAEVARCGGGGGGFFNLAFENVIIDHPQEALFNPDDFLLVENAVVVAIP